MRAKLIENWFSRMQRGERAQEYRIGVGTAHVLATVRAAKSSKNPTWRHATQSSIRQGSPAKTACHFFLPRSPPTRSIAH